MSRLERARAEIARRRAIAEDARHHEPPRTELQIEQALLSRRAMNPCDAAHIAAVSPLPYAVGVLDLADGVLDRHRLVEDFCACLDEWPCPDAAAVLDLYAPEVTSG